MRRSTNRIAPASLVAPRPATPTIRRCPRRSRGQPATPDWLEKEIPMSRIPTHTVEDAPAASRPLLQKIVQSSPGGRPANLHAQMAHSPAVLTAYSSLRAVLVEHGTFEPKIGAALTLA